MYTSALHRCVRNWRGNSRAVVAMAASATSTGVSGGSGRMVVAQQPAHCSFSTRITAPASRRRKAAEKEEEKEQTPDYDFYSEAGRMIDKIRKAVEPMQSINSGFTVVAGGEHALLVTSERGKFVFDTDEGHHTLSMQSYVSGKHFYAFDSSEGVWLSVKDGHDIRGLLTRDLLKHCAGCPIIV